MADSGQIVTGRTAQRSEPQRVADVAEFTAMDQRRCQTGVTDIGDVAAHDYFSRRVIQRGYQITGTGTGDFFAFDIGGSDGRIAVMCSIAMIDCFTAG